MNGKEKFCPSLHILPPSQRRLWDELIDVPPEFTLYGGTAIALHLGHRHSADFDFFGCIKFDPDRLQEAVPFLKGARVIQKAAHTLTCLVDRGGPVQISFFGVPEIKPILWPHIVTETGLKVASLIDLAGMKVAVVQKRAEAKDYIDLDAMFQSGALNLAMALAAGRLIYKESFNPLITLKALSFYEDGNLKTLSLDIQKRLSRAVQKVDLDNLPCLDGIVFSNWGSSNPLEIAP